MLQFFWLTDRATFDDLPTFAPGDLPAALDALAAVFDGTPVDLFVRRSGRSGPFEFRLERAPCAARPEFGRPGVSAPFDQVAEWYEQERARLEALAPLVVEDGLRNRREMDLAP